MHPNPIFRGVAQERTLSFIRDRGFGTLAVNAEGAAPLLSHVPFVMDEGATTVELHLVRSNPIARMLKEPVAAVIAVQGADAYISPDWYEIDDQVPTWNYVAAHLSGTLEMLPHERLRAHLDKLSASFETRLAPKAPWTADKMSEEALSRMMRQIVPCRLTIEQIDSTWKLGQNKDDAVRLRASAQVKTSGVGSELSTLAHLMAEPTAKAS